MATPLRDGIQTVLDAGAIVLARMFERTLPHELRQRRLQRAHRQAWRRYRPGSYQGELTVFIAHDRDGGDPTLGWRRVPGARVQVVPVAGDGDLIASAGLAAALGSLLDRSGDRRGPADSDTSIRSNDRE